MPAKLSFDLARSAVLNMDYQTAIVPIYAQDQDDLLARAVSVLKRARNLGMRINPRPGWLPSKPPGDQLAQPPAQRNQELGKTLADVRGCCWRDSSHSGS
jgi:hypothetical protein